MIFATVGGQMPFERLIRLVDEWAGREGRDDVVAQVGLGLTPRNLDCVRMLAPPEFRATMREARVVVAHAGMGTILTALELGKPLLVLPRLARLGETRNDHQVATARRLAEAGLVAAAFTDSEFLKKLESAELLPAPDPIRERAPDALVERIRSFALGASEAARGARRTSTEHR